MDIVSSCHSLSSTWCWWNSPSILSIIRWLTDDISHHPDLGAQAQSDRCWLISHIYTLCGWLTNDSPVYSCGLLSCWYMAVQFDFLADLAKSKNDIVLYLPIWIWWLWSTLPTYIKVVINSTSLSLDDTMAFQVDSANTTVFYMCRYLRWCLLVAAILPILWKIWLSCILCRISLCYCPLSSLTRPLIRIRHIVQIKYILKHYLAFSVSPQFPADALPELSKSQGESFN